MSIDNKDDSWRPAVILYADFNQEDCKAGDMAMLIMTPREAVSNRPIEWRWKPIKDDGND